MGVDRSFFEDADGRSRWGDGQVFPYCKVDPLRVDFESRVGFVLRVCGVDSEL